MESKFRIEKGTQSHLAEMQQLFVDTISSSVCSSDYNPEQIKVWTSGVEDKERWKEIFLNQYVLIAKYLETIVGFVTLKAGNYIDLFYVHKDFQGQKVAGKLYSAIENEALRQKQSEVTSDVSITARPFFEKIGFEVLKKQTVTRQNVKFTNFKMRKKLSKI